MNNENPPGRIAAFDYGTVRIGIAVSDARQTMAGPYATYTRRTPQLDDEYFRRFVKDEAIVRLVVGLPVHTSGRESQKSVEAEAFGKHLGEITGLNVDFFDERYTSAFAEQILQQAGLTKKRRKERIDQLAAQILLTAYLESPSRGAARPTALDD